MNEEEALQKLADILPPPAPGGANWMWLVGAIVIVAALGLVWFVKRHRPRKPALPAREARQRLVALRAAWQSHTVSDREAAYRLATLLRLGLSLPQLTPQARPTVVEDDALWHEMLTQLHALRYRDHASSAFSPQLFDHAERWLASAQREAR